MVEDVGGATLSSENCIKLTQEEEMEGVLPEDRD